MQQQPAELYPQFQTIEYQTTSPKQISPPAYIFIIDTCVVSATTTLSISSQPDSQECNPVRKASGVYYFFLAPAQILKAETVSSVDYCVWRALGVQKGLVWGG